MTSGYRRDRAQPRPSFRALPDPAPRTAWQAERGRLHSVPLSSATRSALVTSLLRPAQGAFRGLSPLVARHRTDACRRLAWQQVIAHLFRRGLLAVPAKARIATTVRRGLLPGHGRIGTVRRASTSPTGTSARPEDPATRCGRTRPRRETCQSFVSLANGDKIRTLREPNTTITASSSSTRTTQPRPYLSWVTRSRTANRSTGGSTGRTLKGPRGPGSGACRAMGVQLGSWLLLRPAGRRPPRWRASGLGRPTWRRCVHAGCRGPWQVRRRYAAAAVPAGLMLLPAHSRPFPQVSWPRS